jgi:hypothetical protein
LRERRE